MIGIIEKVPAMIMAIHILAALILLPVRGTYTP